MSYSPHTWVNNETITYQKLNNIEEGIQESIQKTVTVIVNFNVSPAIYSSVCCFLYYAKYNSTLGAYSIEGHGLERCGISPWESKFYIPVCLTESGDDLKPYIMFNYNINNMAQFVVTGDISQTKVEGHVRSNTSQWYSETFYGFEVQGNGKIEVYYDD